MKIERIGMRDGSFEARYSVLAVDKIWNGKPVQSYKDGTEM